MSSPDIQTKDEFADRLTDAGWEPAMVQTFKRCAENVAEQFEDNERVEVTIDNPVPDEAFIGKTMRITVSPAGEEYGDRHAGTFSGRSARVAQSLGASAQLNDLHVSLMFSVNDRHDFDSRVEGLQYGRPRTATFDRPTQQGVIDYVEQMFEHCMGFFFDVKRAIDKHYDEAVTLHHEPPEEDPYLTERDEGDAVHVTDVHVDWWHNAANDPELVVHTDGPAPEFLPLELDVGDDEDSGTTVQRNGACVHAYHYGEKANKRAENSDNQSVQSGYVYRHHTVVDPTSMPVLKSYMNGYQSVSPDPLVAMKLQPAEGYRTTVYVELPTALEMVSKYLNGDHGSENNDDAYGHQKYDSWTQEDEREAYQTGTVGFEAQVDTRHAIFTPKLVDSSQRSAGSGNGDNVGGAYVFPPGGTQ